MRCSFTLKILRGQNPTKYFEYKNGKTAAVTTKIADNGAAAAV
jgi:hypothetical protein